MDTRNPLKLDPVLDALARAPTGEEDLTHDELAELGRRSDDLSSGRVKGVSHDEARDGLTRMQKAG